MFYSCHRQYVFKYDRSGRGPQVGVIGEEVQALLPQAVDIVATRSFPNPEKGQPPIVVRRVKGPVPADASYSRPHRAANGRPLHPTGEGLGRGGQKRALHDQYRCRPGEIAMLLD